MFQSITQSSTLLGLVEFLFRVTFLVFFFCDIIVMFKDWTSMANCSHQLTVTMKLKIMYKNRCKIIYIHLFDSK